MTGEVEVGGSDPIASIVRTQKDADPIVDVGPLGMVIPGIDARNTGVHEADGGGEISEVPSPAES